MHKIENIFNRLYNKFEDTFLWPSDDLFFVLAYHRILDVTSSNYPFDEDTISTTTEDFEKQMLFLAQNFNVMNFRHIDRILEQGKKIPKKTVVITFDDGYEDNYKTAFTILKNLGLTATFFVTTGYINTDKVFWFEKVVHQIKSFKEEKIDIYPVNMSIYLGGENRKQNIVKLLARLKTSPDDVRLKTIEYLDTILGVESCKRDSWLVKPLTWDQVLEMSEAGIEIGSHTVTHPILSNMSSEKIRWELIESKNTLEKKLGRSVISLSYPVGNRYAFNKQVISEAKRCGYRFGVSYVHGINRGMKGLFNLKRLHIETEVSIEIFRRMLLCN